MLNTLLKSLVFALLFFTPLLMGGHSTEVFEFPKMFFVYFVGLVLVTFFLLVHIWKPKEEQSKLQLPPKAVLAWLVVNGIATLFSMHLYTSIWGYYSRFSDSLVSLVIFVGIYFVLRNLRNIKVEIPIICSAIPVSLLAIYQHFQLGETIRVYSTLGQANWAAQYLVMVAMLTLGLFLAKPQKVRMLAGGLFILVFAALWYTYSLSGILALAGGIAVFVYLQRKILFQHKKMFSALFVVCAFFAILQPGIYIQRIRDIQTDLLRKVHAQENTQISDPTRIRTLVWQGSLQIALSSPKVFLLGTGPETFPYIFQAYRPAGLNYASEWDFIINKPHNYYLEVLTETGFLGLGSYVYLMYFSFKQKRPEVTAALTGFYISNFFGFPTVATTLLFWTLLATQKKEAYEIN